MSTTMQKNNVHDIKDGWLRIIGTPIVAFMNVYITQLLEPLLEQVPFFKPYIVNIVVVAITWNICRLALIWSRIKFPDMKTFVKRMIIAYIIYFIITLIIVSTYCLLINITDFYGV